MLEGDVNHLGRIAAAVESLGDVPDVAAPLVSERLEALVQLEFDSGVDPFGTPWAPLSPATIATGRHEPPLTDTRELRESFLAYPSTRGVKMSIGTAGHPAGPHQDGWVGPRSSGPARPVFPVTSVPEAWQWAIDDAVTESVTLKFREAR